jgi:glycosidase
MKTLIPLLLIVLLCNTCKNQPKYTSPLNWEDQIIYFAMTDRFFDGKADNNDFGANEYDPNDPIKFQGGDLVGIQQHLDYLENLGATALWITPPVLNQWWNPDTNYTGYHGYWADDFSKMDPHFGTLEEYQSLSKALHQRDMYLVQDIVVNHTGDFFRYKNGYNSDSVSAFFNHYGAPSQYPFNLNDARNSEHIKAGIYHFTPSVMDYSDSNQVLNYQLSDLDDLNTSNPLVQKTLGKSFKHWIEKVDVDAFRFDTPIYVEHDFLNTFLHEKDTTNQGIYPFVEALGRERFYTFGETWVQSGAYDIEGDQKAKKYIGTKDQPEMDGVLNFPLQQTIDRVFTQGQPTDQLTYRLEQQKELFPKTTQLVNFIDNHDMARFRTKGSEAAYKQAMLLLMSIRGVPVIYQGTEQGFVETRQNMFDQLNEATETFQFLKKIIAFRKAHSATQNGEIEILADSKMANGLFIFKIKNEEETLFVALNTLDEAMIVSDINLGKKGNIQPVFSLTNNWKGTTKSRKLAYLELGAREGLVFKLEPNKEKLVKEKVDIELYQKKSSVNNQPFLEAEGTVDGADSVLVLIDGSMNTATKASVKGKRWTVQLDLKNLENGQHFYQAIAYKNGFPSFSKRLKLIRDLEYTATIIYNDKIGDDKGFNGKYEYPTHESFSNQMDIEKVAISRAGNNFSVTVLMPSISTVWNPINGFDHLQLNIFIDLPNQKGQSVLPMLNAKMPNDGDWNYGLMVGGWSMTMFSANGATADRIGTLIGKTPNMIVIKNRSIRLEFSAASIGNPETLDGLKIYISTWDSGGEGGLRPLDLKADSFTFGGGNADDPKIMDDIEVVF